MRSNLVFPSNAHSQKPRMSSDPLPSSAFSAHPDDPVSMALARYNGAAFIVIDRQGRVRSYHGDIIGFGGILPHLAVGQTIEEAFAEHPEHAARYRRAIQGESSTVGFSEGSVQLEVRIDPLINIRGEIEGAIGIGTDVSERENLWKTRLEREAELENLFHNTEDGIYLLDRDFVIQRANTVAGSVHEPNGPLLGKVCYKRIFGIDQPCDHCPVVETFRTGKPAQSSYFDETIQKHLQLNSSPIFDPLTGELTGAFETFRDISDRVEYEATVKSHESLVDDIFSSLQEGVFIIDRDYTMLRTNPVFEKMYPEHMPMVGKKCYTTSLLDEVCDCCPAKTMFETGETVSVVHYEHPTGTKPGMWLEHFSHPIISPDGETTAAVCLIRDITQRKESEEALEQYRGNLETMIEERTRELRRSESRMQALLTNSNSPILFADTDFRLTFVNAAFLDLTGYSEKELLGNTIEIIYGEDPEILESILDFRKKIFAGQIDKYRLEVPLRCKDGRICWGDLNTSAVRDSDGNISQFIIVCLDITQRRQMMSELKKKEEALELDRQRMNDLLELSQMTNSPEQEIIDFTIKSASLLTKSTMGYVVLLEHAADVLPFRSLIFDRSLSCALPTKTDEGTPHTLSASLTECLSTGRPVIHDDFSALPGKRVFPHGHFPVRSHMNLPIFDGDRPIGIMGVGNKETPYSETDVKQLRLVAQGLASQLSRKRYAENMEQAKLEAENANKAKSDFLAHMSHEIRTPLNGVIGLSDLLIGTALSEKQYEYAQLINASGNSLLFLINDILDFSKIEAGKLEVDVEEFNLVATVESVLGILASRATGKKLELGVAFCRNLPKIVRGDSGRIRQILLNLTGNAVKFTERGGVRISVKVESIGTSNITVRFNVEDTGIGIPKERMSRLFKAFSQTDVSSARVYGGTGLGLAISMKLVHLMGGEIGVQSEEGKGSSFWFTIPLGCDPVVSECIQNDIEDCRTSKTHVCPYADGDFCAAISHRGIGRGFEIAGRSVLIVDENEIQRETLQTQLQSWGMKCVSCGSAREAIRLLTEVEERGTPFELIIVDNSLEDSDGLTLCYRLIEREEQFGEEIPPIILLRSLAEELDPEFLRESNTESISKPVYTSALFDGVMNQLFDADKRKKIDSGIFNPNAPDAHKPSKRSSRSSKQSASANSRAKSSFTGQIHLLVVEDNRVNQIVAKNLLQEVGLTCDIANNGHEACAAIRKNHYDVVLMDCQMPEMDGYEATDLIRKWEREQGKPRMPIIALTANATKEDVQKCLDAGMDAYCSKPINPQTVIRLIEAWYVKSTGAKA